jgi:hypothetical protein
MRLHNATVSATRLQEQWLNGNCDATIKQLLEFNKAYGLFVLAYMLNGLDTDDRDRLQRRLALILAE